MSRRNRSYTGKFERIERPLQRPVAPNRKYQAAKRRTLHNVVAQVAMKLRMLVNSLDNVKRAVPYTSWVALYTTLYKTFVSQLDQVLASDTTPADNDFDEEALTGWWDPVDGGLLDLSNWLDSVANGLEAPV